MAGIPVIAQITRQGGANFPIAVGEDIKGAFVTVADTTARDAIQTNILRTGAIVRIGSSSTYYEWNGSAWISFTGFGGGGSAIDWKDSVRFATTAALAASTRVSNTRTANANGAFPTVDGVTAAVGNRFLDKDNATGADRGLWEITSLGSGGTPWVIARTSDADTSAEVTSGMGLVVAEGTANGGKVFLLTTADPITLNTTSLTFTALSSGSSVVASAAPRAKFVMTANDALTGLGARDGYTPVDGDVGYFVGQTTSAQGGYWVMHAGAATRPTFYDSDAGVGALLGALVYVEYGTLGTGTSWQQKTGITLAGAKTFAQLVGNPDTVVGENNSRTELGHDEGTATGRLYSGSRYKKEIASTIAAGATATVWDFDGAALGLSASDVELLAPNVVLDWASDDKAFWGTASALVRHATPPVIIRSKTQDALDSAGGSATAYATIAWDISGNIVRLRVTNNRASACSCVVAVNYLAAQVR